MVSALNYKSKRPISKRRQYLISKSNMVTYQYMHVVSLVIVITKILNSFRLLLISLLSKVIDCFKALYFYLFLL